MNILIFFICFIICCACRAFIRMRNVKDVLRIEDHEMLGINSDNSSHCTRNKIIGNPIYETVSLTNLPIISRHSLQLNRFSF